MHNVDKWPNILLKPYGMNTARFLKYVWLFFNIMHESVKKQNFNRLKFLNSVYTCSNFYGIEADLNEQRPIEF